MELYSPKRFSWGAVVWACVAITLLIASFVTGNVHPAIAALAPAMLAFGLFVGRRREFRAWLRDDSLEVERPALNIPYAEIEGVTINGFSVDPNLPKLKKGNVIVMHRNGVVEIPTTVNAPIQKIYQAILAMLPTTGSYQLSPEFIEHLKKEEAIFGKERVHGFTRRRRLGCRASTRRGQICAALLLLCGIAWCLIYAAVSGTPAKSQYERWLGLGIFLSLCGGFFWLLLYLLQRPVVGNARLSKNAELIVSPTGLAVRQGPLKGHLRWEELLDVKYSQPRFVVQHNDGLTGGLLLVIAGANIRLIDVYDRPLALIHRLIRAYWKGE